MHTPNTVCQAASGVIHRSALRFSTLDYIIAMAALTFSMYGVPLVILLAFVLFPLEEAGRYAATSVATLVLVLTLKRFFGRERPTLQCLGERHVILRHMESNNAMPSGDSAQAGAAAFCLWCATGSWALVWFLPVVMFARVYYGFHWVSDTFVGAALGAGVAWTLSVSCA